MGFRRNAPPANPYGSADIAGLPPPQGDPRPVSLSGLPSSPAPVIVQANQATNIPIGVPNPRQITIQNNTGNPIYRSYAGPASAASLAIAAGATLFDTVSSPNLSLFGTAQFTVNGGSGQVVVEVYP